MPRRHRDNEGVRRVRHSQLNGDKMMRELVRRERRDKAPMRQAMLKAADRAGIELEQLP